MTRRTQGVRRAGVVLAVLAGLGAGLCRASPATAQSALGLEVRGGFHRPMGSAAGEGVPPGAELGWGPSVGVGFAVRRGDAGYILLGFSQHRAECAPADCPRRVQTQWEFGWRQDLARGPLVPWLRAALVLPKVERVWIPAGRRDSGTGWAGEVAVGARVALGGRLHLAPGVRGGWGRVPVDGRDGHLPLRWLIGDVTLVLAF